MKDSISQILAVGAVAAGLGFSTLAETHPGAVDFGKFAGPDKTTTFVEVNLKKNLISLVARLVEFEEPEAAKLLRSVEYVRVNVIGFTDKNRAELTERVHGIRRQLDQQGWERIVTAQEKSGEDVGVYVKTRADEAIQGIVVTALSRGKEAVLVNIVGDVKPEQIAAVGEALDIKPLKEVSAAMK